MISSAWSRASPTGTRSWTGNSMSRVTRKYSPIARSSSSLNAMSLPRKLGPGVPEDFSHCLPYRFGFGVSQSNPVEYDLSETFHFAELCAQLGVKILNLSAGSPYYNPHIQRPAAYPPSDGYQPPEDPLAGVARQINVVRRIAAHVKSLNRSIVKPVDGSGDSTVLRFNDS